MSLPCSFSPIVGWSNDWSWMSSSFTTPEMPSLELRSISGPEPEPKIFAARPDGAGEYRMPLRAPAIASISSMKPIAPPSSRAALRSSLKKLRILRPVWP